MRIIRYKIGEPGFDKLNADKISGVERVAVREAAFGAFELAG